MEITIKEIDKDKFLRKFSKISDAFTAKGKEIDIEETGRGKTTVKYGSDWSSKMGYKWEEIEVPTITYEITGDLQSRGYYIVGLVEQQSDSVIINTLVDQVEGHEIKIPKRFYDMKKIECEECHQNRLRKTGEIVYNPKEDNYLCIGTGCINDFMGFPVDLINKLFAVKEIETDDSRPKVSYGSILQNFVYKSEEVIGTALAFWAVTGRPAQSDDVISAITYIHYLMINNLPLTEENLVKRSPFKNSRFKLIDIINYICSSDTDKDYEDYCKWLATNVNAECFDMYSYRDILKNAENCLLSEEITRNGAAELVKSTYCWKNFDKILAEWERDQEEKRRMKAKEDEFNNLKAGDNITIFLDSINNIHTSDSKRPSHLTSSNGVEYKWWPNQNQEILEALHVEDDGSVKLEATIKNIQNDSWGKAAFITAKKAPQTISVDKSTQKEYMHLDKGEDIMIDVESVDLQNTHGRSYTATITDPNGRKYTYNFNTTYAPKGFKDDIKKAKKVVGVVAADRGQFVGLNGYQPLKIVEKLEESTFSPKDDYLLYDTETGWVYDIDGFLDYLRYQAQFNDNSQWEDSYNHYKDATTMKELWFDMNGEHDFGSSAKVFKFQEDVDNVMSKIDGLEMIDAEETESEFKVVFTYSGDKDISEVCDDIAYYSILGHSDCFKAFEDDGAIIYTYNKEEGYNYF